MFYRLAADDRIMGLSQDWDSAALAQQGHAAVAANVYGHSIWKFVSGHETRSYMNALFFTCRRTQLPVSASYRCDTPTQQRRFRMEIHPLPDGGLEVRHRLVPHLTGQSHSVLVLDDMRPSVQCSQCLSVEISGQWVDQLYTLRDSDFPVHYAVCPTCRTMALSAIEAARQMVKQGAESA